MNRKAFAEALGICVNSLSRKLCNKGPWTDKELYALWRLTGKPVEYLLGWAGSNKESRQLDYLQAGSAVGNHGGATKQAALRRGREHKGN